MPSIGAAELGATSFCASLHIGDQCGANGLPLTPHSICILGRYQRLKKLDHPRLCKYVDLQREKHERVIVVAEHYPQNLYRNLSTRLTYESLLQVTYDILSGLAHLHSEGLVHRNLSPHNILIDSTGRVKLSAYGLFYMTGNGVYVSFPIGVPKYMAPEIICGGIKTPSPLRLDINEPMQFDSEAIIQMSSSPKVDIWSYGIILLEALMGHSLWESLSLGEIFTKILGLVKRDVHPFDVLIKEFDQDDTLKMAPPAFIEFLRSCLNLMPSARPSVKDLQKLPLFTEVFETQRPCTNILDMFSTEVRCSAVDLSQFNNGRLSTTDLLSERSIEEVYYLWKLAGGDLVGTLKRAGVIRSRPPITKIACLVVDDGEMFGEDRDVSMLYDDTVTILSQDQLRQRLSTLDPTAYYPLLEDELAPVGCENGNTSRMASSTSSTDLQESVQLPLVIREKDIEYQFHRIILFERLLIGYPYKKLQIMKEARTDIPPLYRALLWAALLEIEGDVHGRYDSIDKESPISTDRQIEVDIPRCHQYNELLSSPTGHAKFKRLLKAWVVSHPEYVYWQGLDSMCAPFLYLNFNNEAVAFSCLSAFIPKYLHNFFLKDNASVIQEYLAVFSHLIAFQDAQLSTHLDDIGFIPDLYAIPWFLTMYAHVFPLHKIFHLWDTLLLGNSSFPLCIGVAILQQLRDQLLSYGFNECILLFSDMPEIDMERCVQDSIKIFCSTPRSATYRRHAAPTELKKSQHSAKPARPLHATPEKQIQSELAMEPIPLQDLKVERCPRISAEELLELTGLRGATDLIITTKRTKSSRPAICVIDVRSSDEYRRCSVPDSINIPFSTAFTGDGELGVTSHLTNILQARRNQVKVIVGSSRTKHANDFAEQLVRLGYNRVCVLHKGIDVLRHAGVLTVATPDL